MLVRGRAAHIAEVLEAQQMLPKGIKVDALLSAYSDENWDGIEEGTDQEFAAAVRGRGRAAPNAPAPSCFAFDPPATLSRGAAGVSLH